VRSGVAQMWQGQMAWLGDRLAQVVQGGRAGDQDNPEDQRE
jgi:hypothetical protein